MASVEMDEVYFGFAYAGKNAETVEKHFQGDRNAIQKQSVEYALQHLIELAEQYDFIIASTFGDVFLNLLSFLPNGIYFLHHFLQLLYGSWSG